MTEAHRSGRAHPFPAPAIWSPAMRSAPIAWAPALGQDNRILQRLADLDETVWETLVDAGVV